MILPALLALPAAGGALLRGSWDLWAQALLHTASAAGLSLWLSWRILVGYLPLPSRRSLLWTAALLALGAASASMSALHASALPDWRTFLNALWMFPAMAALSKDERRGIDQAVRAAALVLMTLAFYQRMVLRDPAPSSALVNPNVYAGAVLMLLPLALETGDRLLALGLLISLSWTQSVGAWLGLFSSMLLSRSLRRTGWFWVGAAGALLCLGAIYDRLQSPEFLHRWTWWGAALRMAWDKPLLGHGPGVFALLLPAYQQREGLSTLYAHQYFLQTAAEYGLPFAALWFGGLWHCLRRGTSHKRFGARAVLIHSLWDWTLSMPSNLWLFSYFAASSIPEGSRGVNIPSRWRVPAAFAALCVGGWLMKGALDPWAASRAERGAAQRLASGAVEDARRLCAEAVRLAPEDFQAHLTSAEVELEAARLASTPETAARALSSSAASLERAAELNPHRRPTWTLLSAVYTRMGLSDLSASARARAARRFPAGEGP